MEYAQMRDFSEFCEQLNEIRHRFHRWDSCERTIALYYLMVGLPFANAKFLQHALEQCITAVNTPDAQILERNANDPHFIGSVLNETPQVGLSTLLAHLPLLRPGNKEAADCYVMTIRQVLSEFITPPYKIYNECVEIMSYVFVHPAFGKDEKKSFKQLLKQVVSRVSPDNFVHSPVNESSDESISPNPEPVILPPQSTNSDRLNRRSNSLTPAQTNSHEFLSSDVFSSQENLSNQTSKPRSYSLSSDKTLRVTTIQSSSSETRLQDLQSISNLPIMKSIVSWLKSLRLHKYSWVFNNLTYEQMLTLTEESLLSIGITKGARHKLLISINKLKERSFMLRELETEVMNGGDLLNALKRLKGVLQSPLQVTNGEDLPSQFIKVMGKVCTQLLMLRQPSEECLTLFSSLCERADNSDAFSIEQKRRLNCWRSQLVRASTQSHPIHIQRPHSNNFRHIQHQSAATAPHSYPIPPPSVTSNTPPPNSLQHHLHQSYNLSPQSHAPHSTSSPFTQKSSSYPNMQQSTITSQPPHRIHQLQQPQSQHQPTQPQPQHAHRHSLGSVTLNNVLQAMQLTLSQSSGGGNDSANDSGGNRFATSDLDTTTGSFNIVQQSQQPQLQQHYHVRFKDVPVVERVSALKSVDIESSLESLCLQMMEHALGP